VQQESGVIHVVATRLDDLTALLARLTEDAPASDLDVPARGSAHSPTRRAGTKASAPHR